jgi:hypothetical protein
MRIGDRVFWEDSHPDGNSGIGTVVSLECEPVDDGTLIGIDMDDGCFVEAFRHELRTDMAGSCGSQFTDDDDSGYREELFEMCLHLGWPPIELPDRPFAAQYREWLARQLT